MLDENAVKEFLDKALKDGPSLDRSDFQIQKFVIEKHGTGARAYRQILLEFSDRFRTLQKARIRRERLNLKLAELEAKYEKSKSPYIKLDIEEKIIDRDHEDKLVMDAIHICNLLWAALEKSKKYTRAEAEAEENTYWEQRLIGDAELQVLSKGTIDPGTSQSLGYIGVNPVDVQISLAHQLKQIESIPTLGLVKKAAE